MAKDKKGFILYADLIYTVDKMPSEKAGDLFKHILKYVNDLNPITTDLIIELTFEPIKQQLKRDLNKWEDKSQKRSNIGREGGLKSGEARRSKLKQNEPIGSKLKQNEPIGSKLKQNEQVTVNVNDIISKDINKKVSFENSNLFDKNIFAEKFKDWNKKKLLYYYDSALSYSQEGNKYVNWGSAINNWAKRDELQGKLKFEDEKIARPYPMGLI
jgi:hypothetical protein